MAGNKAVRLVLTGDNKDAKDKLEEVDLKADELAAKHPELKIGIDTAAAAEKLAILRAEMRETAKDSKDTSGSLDGLKGALNLLVTGGISPNIGEMTLFQKAMVGLNFATGIGEPAVAGLTVAIGGLGAGLVAGGLGLGAFGLAAESAYSQVSAANTAGTKLTGGLGDMQRELKTATTAYDAFGKAASPGVAEVLGKALGLIPEALKAAQPFLEPTEQAISGLIGTLGKGLGSSGFKNWIDAFAKASGPNITNLGHAIGNIVVGIGGILKAFLPMATTMTHGLDDITSRFAKWGETLTSHSGFQSLETMAKQDAPLLGHALENIGVAVKNLLGDMAGLSTFSNSKMLLQLAGPISSIIKSLSGHPDLVNLGLWAVTAYQGFQKLNNGFQAVKSGFEAFDKFGTQVQNLAIKLGILKDAAVEEGIAQEGAGDDAEEAAAKLGILKGATEEETVAQEGMDGAMDANPIGLIVLAIGALVVGIVELWDHSSAFRDFWIDAWKDIRNIVEIAFDWVKSHWPLVLGILTGPIGLAAEQIISHWHQIVSGASEMFDNVIGFFRAIPGRIVSLLGDLGSLLFNAGDSILTGFLNGLISAWDKVSSFVSGIAGWISSHKGPIEVDAVLLQPHGRAIMGGLVNGLQDGMPGLNAQLSRTTNAIANTRVSGAGASGSNAPLQVEWIGGAGADQGFITWLKENIRIRGGQPAVLGR